MVQTSSEGLTQGQTLHIRISTRDETHDEMELIQNAARIAQETSYEAPTWTTQSEVSVPPEDLPTITQRAIDIYMLSKQPNGTMGGISWWQTASGYTAMALHDLWSRQSCNYPALYAAIRKCETNNPGLINVFNDDTLWWAMLCMHMYAIEGDRWFLEKAEGVWKHVRKSVCRRGEVWFQGRDMEGAVLWTTRDGEEQINAVTAGLFAELSVRLALVELARERNSKSEQFSTGNRGGMTASEYLDTARPSLAWILRHRYRPHEGIVLDNILLEHQKARDWIFTYNTGVTLGVCALLYEATRENEYLTLACHMARKAMTRTGWVEDNCVLTEKGAYGRGTHDPWKANDAVGFKAVLVRELGVLRDVISRTSCEDAKAMGVKDMIMKFVHINFQSQIERNTNGEGQYGPWWNGPFECPSSHSQMAVLDVMAAVVLVNR